MRQAPPISIYDVMFVDIETVSDTRYFQNEGKRAELFKKKFNYEFNAGSNWETLHDKSALHAEFGKIVNISVGSLRKTDTKGDILYVKSYRGSNEKQIIEDFVAGMENLHPTILCAHNGIEFDFPFLFRRALILGVTPPGILNAFGKKPWELTDSLHDTMKIWGGTQFNHKISLDMLAYLFGIESPKKDMDGSMVQELFWGMFDNNQELPFDAEKRVWDKIGTYGAGDIITLAKLYCKISGLYAAGIKDEQIQIIDYTPTPIQNEKN